MKELFKIAKEGIFILILLLGIGLQEVGLAKYYSSAVF